MGVGWGGEVDLRVGDIRNFVVDVLSEMGEIEFKLAFSFFKRRGLFSRKIVFRN